MHPHRPSSKTLGSKTLGIAVFLTAVAFFLLALTFAPLLGIQNDEALFATVQYGPVAKEFRMRAFHHDVPLMVMTYLGTLKSLFFAGVFTIWNPSLWSIRIPQALLGAITVFLFALLLNKASKLRWVGLSGAILLATDPSYLLTTVFDWGPVVFQHLFLVSGCLFLLQFHHTKREKFLILGFGCLGLGLWDKALLSWSLFGLGLATLLVFRKELFRLLSFRNAAIATASLLVGALPLVIYNARNNLKTFRGNAKLSWSEVAPKWVPAKSTLDGSALFGYLVREEWEKQSITLAPGSFAALSFNLRTRTGEHRQSWGYVGFLLAAGAIPLWWTCRRAVLFCLIYLGGAWLLMAATHDAGASAHHAVLLWPFPQFVIAIAIGCLAERFNRLGMALAGLIMGLLVTQNLLVLNQYYTQASRFCGGTVWTDAIEPLRQSIVNRKPQAVNTMGWGLDYTLTMLEKGTLPLRHAAGYVADEKPGVDDQNAIRAILNEPNGIFVGHTAELELQPGITKRFETVANGFGFQKEMLESIPDRCGRPTFEVYRYVRN